MTEYSGAIFTDARRLVACPKCEAQPGEHCLMPSGRKARTPHWQRCRELRQQHPGAIAAATHSFSREQYAERGQS